MLRLGIVSVEKHWAHQMSAIFPEWEMHVEQIQNPAGILNGAFPKWDALVLDLDVLEPQTKDLMQFLEQAAAHSRHMIVLVPARLSHLDPKFTGTGIFLLRKPTSSGEIALALRMLLKPA